MTSIQSKVGILTNTREDYKMNFGETGDYGGNVKIMNQETEIKHLEVSDLTGLI
jgi:hypothetical protein